jgi:hypothetical protein
MPWGLLQSKSTLYRNPQLSESIKKLYAGSFAALFFHHLRHFRYLRVTLANLFLSLGASDRSKVVKKNKKSKIFTLAQITSQINLQTGKVPTFQRFK